MEKEKQNPCKGCYCVSSDYTCMAHTDIFVGGEQCPCSTCLIKGVCKEMCAKYIEYADYSFQHGIDKITKIVRKNNEC
jgi:hypothetical protein